MSLIYLDYNCFQRGFDDATQIKIQLEALACEEIFTRVEKKDIKLVWSFMHEDENILCPFIERKLEVERLSTICKIRVGPEKEIYNLANDFQVRAKISSKDAIHLACAQYAKCKFFITCDNDLIKNAKKLNFNMEVMNPIDYIREVRI